MICALVKRESKTWSESFSGVLPLTHPFTFLIKLWKSKQKEISTGKREENGEEKGWRWKCKSHIGFRLVKNREENREGKGAHQASVQTKSSETFLEVRTNKNRTKKQNAEENGEEKGWRWKCKNQTKKKNAEHLPRHLGGNGRDVRKSRTGVCVCGRERECSWEWMRVGVNGASAGWCGGTGVETSAREWRVVCDFKTSLCAGVEKVCRLRVVCNFKGVEKVCRLWGAALVPRSYQCTGDGYRELGVGM